MERWGDRDIEETGLENFKAHCISRSHHIEILLLVLAGNGQPQDWVCARGWEDSQSQNTQSRSNPGDAYNWD